MPRCILCEEKFKFISETRSKLCPDCIEYLKLQGKTTCIWCGKVCYYDDIINGLCPACWHVESSSQEGELSEIGIEFVSYETLQEYAIEDDYDD
jgi:hypothetical protein